MLVCEQKGMILRETEGKQRRKLFVYLSYVRRFLLFPEIVFDAYRETPLPAMISGIIAANAQKSLDTPAS